MGTRRLITILGCTAPSAEDGKHEASESFGLLLWVMWCRVVLTIITGGASRRIEPYRVCTRPRPGGTRQIRGNDSNRKRAPLVHMPFEHPGDLYFNAC